MTTELTDNGGGNYTGAGCVAQVGDRGATLTAGEFDVKFTLKRGAEAVAYVHVRAGEELPISRNLSEVDGVEIG